MAITKEDVLHVAKLAKLTFQENEIEQFTSQLSDIINMVEQLNEVDTTGVPVTTHGMLSVNVYREDVAQKGTNRELLFENVPHKKDGFIQVPAMLEGEGDA